MDNNRNLRIDPARESALAKLCLLHLDCEQALLAATEDVLRQVYAAAIEGNRPGMTLALKHQEGAEKALAELRQQRDSFRRQAGACLGIPAESVTLNGLAPYFRPEILTRLLEKRQCLQKKVTQVQRLGRDIALLSHYILDFLKRFFVDITGGMKCGRYGREGLRHEPACGSLLQAKG
jgi:hypothetical protein